MQVEKIVINPLVLESKKHVEVALMKEAKRVELENQRMKDNWGGGSRGYSVENLTGGGEEEVEALSWGGVE